MALACYNGSVLQLLETSLDYDDYLLEACNALAEDGLIGLVARYLHGLDHLLRLHLVEFAEQRIFLEGPLDEIFEGDIINLIVKDSVESVSSQHQASHLIISFDGQLPHSVVVQ